MLVEKELAGFSPDRGMWLTVGVFDGVHLGHQRLISELAARAREHSCKSGVVTFRQHPEEVLAGARLAYITTFEERVRLLREAGAATVIILSFTPELVSLAPRDFAGLLKRHLRMEGLVVGPDFALGKDRQGSGPFLRQLGEEMGFEVVVVPPVVIEGEAVSSTAVREALAAGDMARVRRLTGRAFRVSGKVVSGDGRGALLGYPTANLESDPEQALPGDGVYACRAYVGGQGYPAVANIGQRPTFGGGRRTFEVHLIGYKGDIYGQELDVLIAGRIRGERRFETPEALKSQIANDIRKAGTIL